MHHPFTTVLVLPIMMVVGLQLITLHTDALPSMMRANKMHFLNLLDWLPVATQNLNMKLCRTVWFWMVFQQVLALATHQETLELHLLPPIHHLVPVRHLGEYEKVS